MKHIVTVNKEGKIPKAATEAIRQELLLLAGKKAFINIGKYVKERSNNQLRYWFGGIVKPFGIKFGYDKDTAHKILKVWCGWTNIESDPDGNEVKVIRSINRNEDGNKSSTMDLMRLIDTAIQKCAEHDLIIESADDYYTDNPNEY